ncbi:MAG: GNAT family N-acetyltransferase [Candidatus Bathyarchaeota archaeon]|nr:GNAT family N-acetyltransferase [Candidatus Bathyarchaeota archaeon]MDH5733569.1 GNAT family N-acetyltransferase [Candidatus Bathyarchaeota archaeon]
MRVRAAKPGEYEEIGEMVHHAFQQGSGTDLERCIVKVITTEDPNFHEGDLRVTEAEGKIVSMMLIIRRPIRIGTAIVKGAMVAPVATHPIHQRKGYCSAVMRDAINYMKKQNLDITLLWGHPWLYPKYGYSPAMPFSRLVINTERCKKVETEPHTLEPFDEHSIKEVTKIYHNNTATRTCAEMRSPELYEWKLRSPYIDFETIIDQKGEIIGYVVFTLQNPEEHVPEIGVLNDLACRAVFNRILELARERRIKDVICVVPPDHPFSSFASWKNAEQRITQSGAGMIRVLNLVSLLKKMREEFGRRLAHSEFHNLTSTLNVVSEEGAARLAITEGKVTVNTDVTTGDCQLDIPIASLNPLITGYKSIHDLLQEIVLSTKGKNIIRLIDVLFPKGFSFGGRLPLVWE